MPEVALLVADKICIVGNVHSAAILERYAFNNGNLMEKSATPLHHLLEESYSVAAAIEISFPGKDGKWLSSKKPLQWFELLRRGGAKSASAATQTTP